MTDLDFNELFDMTFYEQLPEDMKEAVQRAGFKLDDKGFVIDLEGKDVTYIQLKKLTEE